MRAFHLVGLCLLLAADASAQNWPAFRGPGAAGTIEGAKPPQAWSVKTGKNVQWKTPIPGLAHASPIVWGDRVFVATSVQLEGEPVFRHGLYGDVDTTSNEGDISWRLYALDRATGKVLWEREAAKAKPRVNRHIKATHANSTPVTDGRTVVVYFGSEGGLYAYDFEGKQLWRTEVGPADTGWFYDASYQWGHASSPVVWRDRVILQADQAKDSFLAAYALADGKQLWRTPRPELPSWGTPLVVESDRGPEIVCHGGHAIRGYDPETGQERWRLEPTSEVTVGSPVAAHGLVFVSNGYRPVQPIYAIRPGGSGDLSLAAGSTSSERIAWSHDKGGTYIPTPLVVGDLFYTLADNGTLTSYDARTGEQVYRQRVGGGRAAFTASPVAGDGRLYLSSEDGDVYVIRAGRSYESLEVNSMGEVIMATPALSGDLLIVRSREHVWGLKEAPPAAPATGAGAAE